MKLKQFLRPQDSYFSTPKAARKLLWILAWVSMVCLVCALSLFLGAAFNNEVSQLRRQMNAAMFDAQDYLYQRESLLEHISRGVTFEQRGPLVQWRQLSAPVAPHEHIYVTLGDPARQWSLSLSGRDMSEMEQKRLNLIYISPGAEPQVTRLYGSPALNAVVPTQVLEALAAPGTQKEEQQVRWLAEPSDPQSRQYLFTRVASEEDAGWLGLEMFGADIGSAFNVPEAGSFLLMDRLHRALLGTSVTPLLGQQFSGLWEHDTFSFSGPGLIPQHLALLKHLGSSDWSLIYYFDLASLLLPLWPKLAASLVLLMTGAFSVWGLSRRIDRRLIIPAQRRLEALVESERFSRTMIQTAPVALCVVRRNDAAVVLENRLAQQWLGGGEARRQWVCGWLERAFECGSDGGSDEIDTVTGKHLYLCFTPTRYKGAEVLCCAFSDISARKQTEQALAEAKRLSDAANEAKTLFLATMSHEIRTPLYGVLGTLELLGRTALDHQQSGYLRAIQRSSATLLQLISDVLDVSKIEVGQLGLELVEFSPVELTLDAVDSYAAAARAKGLQVYAICDPQMPERVLGDSSRIQQILNNLLSNAVKFTDSGRIVIRVRADVLEGRQLLVHWQVTDTGIGIPADMQDHLFDPFFQVTGHARVAGGTGLGLSICKRLADLMHGQLRVVSDVGLGSSFSLSLPLQRVDAPPGNEPRLCASLVWVHAPSRELAESLCGWINRWGARAQVVQVDQPFEQDTGSVLLDVRFNPNERTPLPAWQGCRVVVSDVGGEQPRQQDCDWHVGRYNLSGIYRAIALAQGCNSADSARQADSPSDGALGLRVLLVEDNPINQLILRDQLETLGCSVELAADGKQALGRWQDGAFDAVLTDVNMPNMNGYELTRALRQRGCRVPIVGATANAMHEENERCLAAGMDRCLLKPVDLRTLRQCLTTLPTEAHACGPSES
ncbi:ATP-binding protein [Pseudomonas sp. ZM23]|uniref:histidine kinase n=1 Tax=Pseudomonas triclosanedens TaxID=2961893 RepID=A0ABY7A3R0_9PSED|nr:ATP-binding protein [Pseudomonas triclosanedens]MCP8464675.1 ATP-binding protein [Pseudomonas triclosanedens]MCP8473606.1 ATP-binding protein [Pseudomonas triclosanedens]MCP8478443.1 ATP-binding protein [Pseudomonas triclosanedens]WAI50845.1 ATP-binding protein [Pseudomonas triclosanedens]